MALKARLDTLDGLPDAIKSEYKEVKEGEETYYMLDAEGVEDVSGLKSALQKERKSRGAAEKALKKMGLKADEESVDALMEKLGDRTLDEVLEELAGKAGDVSAEVTRATKKLERQLGEKDGEVAKLTQALESTVVRAQATEAIIAEEGSPKILMPHIRRFLKPVAEETADGETEYVLQVVDAKGEPRTKGGKDMTVKDLVLEFKADPEFAVAFAGSGASGSGASGTGGGKARPSTGSANTKQPSAAAKKAAQVNYSI
jgi:hypothetical protein